MHYFNWLLRTVLFFVLLGFAVKNDQSVTLRYFFGYEWHAPLVLVLLIFFVAGAVVGILAMFTNVLQQRRKISNLQEKIRIRDKLVHTGEKLPSIPSS